MKTPTIFISYNPDSDFEQTLAVRLHTTGAVNGFKMFLPDRYNSDSEIDTETKARISQSDWLIVFSTGKLSNIVKQEIQYAWKEFNDKSKILVIYNFEKGKNLEGEITKHFTEIYFNPNDDFDKIILGKIFPKIQIKERTENQKEIKEIKQQRNALLALLGIGVGLLLLGGSSE
ncbi:MAG: TIR domain-containing protein [Chlorobi bacterium]|nr:TIR domain-containing protein [Chlorobiota bacterium]